jgi:hypothetical protein
VTEWLAALRKAFARGFTLRADVLRRGAWPVAVAARPRRQFPGADFYAAGCRSRRERRWPLTKWPLALQALFSTDRRPSIGAHNRMIRARPSAQRTLLTAAPSRRSEIVRAKDNVSDYSGA